MSEHLALSPDQADDLRLLSGLIIPASAEHCVPGADDPTIQADIIATLGRDAGAVRTALALLASLAGDRKRRARHKEKARGTGVRRAVHKRRVTCRSRAAREDQ